MIENGFISWLLTQSVIDEDGNPIIDDTQQWSEAVPANIEGSVNRVYNDNNSNRYTKSTYSIILSNDQLPDTQSDRVRLYDNKKNFLGEYAVLYTQNLPIMGEIRIVV